MITPTNAAVNGPNTLLSRRLHGAGLRGKHLNVQIPNSDRMMMHNIHDRKVGVVRVCVSACLSMCDGRITP